MTRRSKIAASVGAAVLIELLLFGPCPTFLFGRHMSLGQLQRRGGIAPGDASRNSLGAVQLNIRCDLSGTEAITHEPTELSGIYSIKEIRVDVEGNRIVLRVYQFIGGLGRAEPVDIGRIDPGLYSVWYEDPDGTVNQIGTVQVP